VERRSTTCSPRYGIDDGKAARLRAFATVEEALEAVGLSE
jgi:hypothetical protein